MGETPKPPPQAFGIHQDDTTPASQGATTLVTSAQRPRFRLSVALPALALPAVLAIGVAGRFFHRQAIAATDDPATTSASPISTAAAAPSGPAVQSPSAEERTVRLAVEPLDATVEVDGQPAQVRDGAVELRGVLGSVHSVRLVKGSQEATSAVAVTPVGALPERVRIEPKAKPPQKPRSPALNRKFE